MGKHGSWEDYTETRQLTLQNKNKAGLADSARKIVAHVGFCVGLQALHILGSAGFCFSVRDC